MRTRRKIFLSLCGAAILTGCAYRIHVYGKEPLPVPPVPVERQAQPDTSGVFRLLARFNPKGAEGLTALVYKASERFDIAPQIIAGLICTESSAHPEARNKGCLGLGQVHWAVWGKELKARGIALKASDLHDPHRGLTASVMVLRHYLDQAGSIREALKRYSGGAGKWYADRVLRYAGEAGL
jgi:soluble lytic murein transglycosylase-like protein